MFLIGPTGIGKSWLACALAHKACRDGYTVHYTRVPRLFAELEMQHGDGRYATLFRTLVKADLLILDDWGPDRLTANQRRDLMEIVEDRYGRGATLITSQLPATSGTRSLETRLSPTPSSIALSTTPIGWNWTGHPCASSKPDRRLRRSNRRRPLSRNQQRRTRNARRNSAPVGQQGPPARAATSAP